MLTGDDAAALSGVFRSQNLGRPINAQDFQINSPLTSGDKLPKKGTATYSGQFQLSGGYVGTTGSIQLFVDFASRSVAADLTIPALSPDVAPSPPVHYTPTGVISANGSQPATYTLTQGISFSTDSPFIELSPNFGDGLRVQAAAVREAGLAATSIPSVNVTPRMSLGNWLWPSSLRQLFCAAFGASCYALSTI